MKQGQQKKKLRLQAERLWKELVIKQANGVCEICGKTASIAHHFVPRSQSGILKFNPKNGICICLSCHFAHHTKSDPYIHDCIIRKRGQVWADSLYLIRNQPIESSYKSIRFYEGIIAGLKNELLHAD